MLAPDPADLILVALPRRPSFAGGRPSSAGGNGWLPDFGRNSRSKRGSAECIDPLDVRRDGKTEECCTSKGLLIDGGGGRKSSSRWLPVLGQALKKIIMTHFVTSESEIPLP